MSTEEKVIDTISRYAVIDKVAAIEKSHNLRDDLELDSLDLIELWMDLERKFNVEVPQEMVEGLTDVQSVINVVESILSAFANAK